MNTPHKHAAVIKAWADGATIECRAGPDYSWEVVSPPSWYLSWNYRIKPERVVFFARAVNTAKNSVCLAAGFARQEENLDDNLKLTFEDGKLIDAKVLAQGSPS